MEIVDQAKKARNPLGFHANLKVGKTASGKGSTLVLGLWQADRGAAGFPFATLLEKLDALEALENGAFAADGGACFEAVMLGHRGRS
jgi:hypothetical protein